uniref:leukocyte immunoglobulin-like receptor subfamily A member 6 n=1 Tax=Arvicanthis niloticus TaxID=61156 RepID=UPI001486E9AB|nr:leukocyte immunoglobulin-like receptor subfamily A member 6 [Arvicanthis niloticus]
MTPTLTALLYLGAFSKPTIKVVPSNVVTNGQEVTIFCEGSLHAKEYRLHKEGSPDYLIPTNLLETENKAKFSISPIQWNHAGQYWCSYKTPTNMLRQSDITELVVTGVINGEVRLSALPSYVVTSGGNVTLQCASQVTYDRFILMKEDEKFSTVVPSWHTYPALRQALFTVGPVTSNQRWRFTCYGYYLSNSQMWSRPSNHLELLVPGVYKKPIISALQSPVVNLGVFVNISCTANQTFNWFILRTDDQKIYRSFGLQDPYSMASLARFQVGPITSGQRWRFRCYGYSEDDPQVWSESSDPLEFLFSVSQPQDYTVENLIRMGVSVLVLVLLGILLFEAQHSQRQTQHTAGRESSASFMVAESCE